MASRWELASFLVAVLLGSGAGQLPFDCPKLPPLQHPAKSVYELRPQDIKVIMSLGDSVTAGGFPNGKGHTSGAQYSLCEVLPLRYSAEDKLN